MTIRLENIAPISPRAASPDSEVAGFAMNGHGSVNTHIRRVTAANVTTIGSGITFNDSATDGSSFTINEDGVYAFYYNDGRSGSTCSIGITVNAPSLNTPATDTPNQPFLLGVVQTASTNSSDNVAGTARLKAGDVLRMHTDSTPTFGGDSQKIRITQLYKLDKPVNTLVEDNLNSLTEFTPTYVNDTGVTIVDANTWFMRIGGSMFINWSGRISAGNGTDSGGFGIRIPDNLNTSVSDTYLGAGMQSYDGGATDKRSFPAAFRINSGVTDTIFLAREDFAGARAGTNMGVDGGGNDYYSWSISGLIPIAEWQGSQNSLVGFSDATIPQSGLVKKSQVLTKYMATDYTSGAGYVDAQGSTSDFQFTGLTSGKWYTVNIQLVVFNSASYYAEVFNDSDLTASPSTSVRVGRLRFTQTGGSSSDDHFVSATFTFKATQPHLRFKNVTGETYNGTGSTEETFATLVQHENYDDAADFN